MTKSLTLYELTGSPNSVKVRIALDVKGLEYERVPIEIDAYPGDRSLPSEVSSQPLLPVLKHGETAIFDSRGILRYLDANFRETHRLFSNEIPVMREIENWELWSTTECGPPVHALFEQIMSGAPDPAICARASQEFNGVAAKIEEALADGPFLLGDQITAADVVCAPSLFLSMLPESCCTESPIYAAFHQLFHLGEGRERTRKWVRKLIEHDPVSRQFF